MGGVLVQGSGCERCSKTRGERKKDRRKIKRSLPQIDNLNGGDGRDSEIVFVTTCTKRST